MCPAGQTFSEEFSMAETFVIAQGGGPTAVINQTVVGARPIISSTCSGMSSGRRKTFTMSTGGRTLRRPRTTGTPRISRTFG